MDTINDSSIVTKKYVDKKVDTAVEDLTTIIDKNTKDFNTYKSELKNSLNDSFKNINTKITDSVTTTESYIDSKVSECKEYTDTVNKGKNDYVDKVINLLREDMEDADNKIKDIITVKEVNMNTSINSNYEKLTSYIQEQNTLLTQNVISKETCIRNDYAECDYQLKKYIDSIKRILKEYVDDKNHNVWKYVESTVKKLMNYINAKNGELVIENTKLKKELESTVTSFNIYKEETRKTLIDIIKRIEHLEYRI